MKEKTGTVGRRESAVRNVTEELMKANDIIRGVKRISMENSESLDWVYVFFIYLFF